MNKKTLPTGAYKLLILVATLIWGASFVFMKDAVDAVPPSWLIGIRFLITAVILTLVFLPKVRANFNRRTILHGAVAGAVTFAAYWFQTVGLVYTTPGKNAFLTAIYCVLVPFIYWIVAHRRPGLHNVFAGIICIAGVGLVSMTDGNFSIGFGDAMTIVCGVFFAVQIVVISVFTQKTDCLALTVWMFWFAGAMAIVVGAATEPAPEISALTNPDFLFNLFYLVVFSSCIAMGLQNLAIAHVSAAQASILLSTESVFGVVFSVLIYGEALSLRLLAGFGLIFGAILLSEAFPSKKQKGGEGEASPKLSTADKNAASADDIPVSQTKESAQTPRAVGDGHANAHPRKCDLSALPSPSPFEAAANLE